jgi:hypothetical protein
MPERDYKVKARKKNTNKVGSFSCALSKHPGKWKWSHPSSSFQFRIARRNGVFFFFFALEAECLFFFGLNRTSPPVHTACRGLLCSSYVVADARPGAPPVCGAVAHSPRHEDEGRHCSCSPVLKPDAVAHLPAGGRHSARWCHIWATLWTPPARSPWLPSA